MSTELLQKIITADNLPSLPVVALEVLELTAADDVSVKDIAEVIQRDPALAAKILKVANSSMFGLSKKVSSLQQAMVILGLRTVKVMALSFALVDQMSSASHSSFDHQRYWRRSLTMSAAAKLLAEKTRLATGEEAYIAGLLADLGILAAVHAVPKIYEPVLEAAAANNLPIQEAEIQILGFSHAKITAELLLKWSLPESLAVAVGAHHGEGWDELPKEHAPLATLIGAAALIADMLSPNSDPESLLDTEEQCAELTGLKQEDIQKLLEELESHVKESAALFSVDIGETVSYDTLRQSAMARLAQLSVSAEIDRAAAAKREEEALEQVESLSEERAALREEANTDALTGITNRRGFDTHLKRCIETAKRDKKSVGLIMIDVDHFKKFNDNHGHATGDEALRILGAILKKVSRGACLASRYGGEEFVAVVYDKPSEKVFELAEYLRKEIAAAPVKADGRELPLTASFGVTHVDLATEIATDTEMKDRADACLYEAKHAGRNRVHTDF